MREKPFRIFSDLDVRSASAALKALEEIDCLEIVDDPPKKDDHELLLPTLMGMAAGSLHPRMIDHMFGSYSPKREKTEQDLIRDEEKKQKAQAKRDRKALRNLTNKV